jgi:hypothetical protein
MEICKPEPEPVMVSLAVGGLLWLDRHHPRPVNLAPSSARCISLRRLFLHGIGANARHVKRKAMSTTYEPARPRVPYELTPANIPGAYVSPAIPEDFVVRPPTPARRAARSGSVPSRGNGGPMTA